MKTQEELIIEMCDELKNLLIKKNRDYDDSFSKQYQKYGILSGLIRMDDKMNRLANLTKGDKSEVAESIEDSCLDLCGYSILTLVEMRKENTYSKG
jgi:hypothetical protein